MKIKTEDYQIPEGAVIDLRKWPTRVAPLYKSKKKYRSLLAAQTKALVPLQRLLYAFNRHAVLLIFHGMDTAGKDGAIRHVMSGINPQGCQVFSFKQPSSEELDHDFLWRTAKRLPERGRIGIFNRSYYEEVLIVRVHPELLLGQGLPSESLNERAIWSERYHSIVEHEVHLHRSGTKIIKFFLHLSEDEQRKRLLKRIDDPERNWKLSEADVEERKLWAYYMRAYETCLAATSTTDNPWYAIPADDKRNARLIISTIILNLFNNLKMNFPESNKARREELRSIRKTLADKKSPQMRVTSTQVRETS